MNNNCNDFSAICSFMLNNKENHYFSNKHQGCITEKLNKNSLEACFIRRRFGKPD